MIRITDNLSVTPESVRCISLDRRGIKVRITLGPGSAQSTYVDEALWLVKGDAKLSFNALHNQINQQMGYYEPYLNRPSTEQKDKQVAS